MIATLVVSTLYQLITPVFNVIYPRFTSLYAKAEHGDLRDSYRLMTALVAAIVFPLAMWLMVWGEGLVRLWTGSAAIAGDVAPVVALLAAGSGLHAVMYVVYALQLAQGEAKLALKISLALLIVQVPLVWYLTVQWGGVGAAAAWLTLHVVYLLFGGWATHRRLQPGLAWGWLLRDVGPPLALSLLVGSIAWLVQRAAGPQSWPAVLLGAAAAALLMLGGLLSSARLRPRVLALLTSVMRRGANT
jgi:O-antigen/teichoic acid export membrane protein